MHDDENFLADIREAPEDDRPRLVYADWLDEQGDTSRAEVIRLQCQLAATPWDTEGRAKLQNRETALFRKHKKSWLGQFSDLVRTAHFERGFVDSISLSPKQFVQHGDEIFARAPVRKVTLLQISDKTAPQVAEVSALQKVRDLNISGHLMSAKGWNAILTSPHLKATSLDLSLGPPATSAEVLTALSRSPGLSELTQLSGFFGIDDRETEALFAALKMPKMQNLALPFNDGDALRVVGEQPYFVRLTRLDVSHNFMNQSTYRRLPHPAVSLKHIKLDSIGFNDRDAKNLVRSEKFPALETLDLSFNEVTDKGLCELASMPNLKRIDLGHNPIRGEKMRALANAVAPLEELTIIHHATFAASGVEMLASQFPLKRLTINARLTDKSCVPLIESPRMSGLRSLDLDNNKLTNQTAKRILKSPHLENLRRLSMRFNNIDNDTKKMLRQHFGPGVCTFSA